MNSLIYLDNSATTCCDPRVLETMLPYFTEHYGNPSSRNHAFGWTAETAVEEARKSVASLIGATAQEIVFTSGATEACNLALRGVAERFATKGNHIITTRVEHKAVLDTCKALEKNGVEISYLDVDNMGLLHPETVRAAITPRTILIAQMYANNETGVVQPIREIGAIAKEQKILFFCDATQAVGKIHVSVQDDTIDLLALSSHKIYGPKGVGALYLRRKNPRVTLTPQITGGGQERDVRSGTSNVPGIVGLGKACTICKNEMQSEALRLQELRDYLENGLLAIEASRINGHPQKRLPHICNISFNTLISSQLLAALNKTMALSSGSACTSGSRDPSYVLKAMGLDENWARAAIRFSLGRFTTKKEIDIAIAEVKRVVEQLRSESFEWQLLKQKTIP